MTKLIVIKCLLFKYFIDLFNNSRLIFAETSQENDNGATTNNNNHTSPVNKRKGFSG